jgi:hypothetical protein
LIEISLDDTSTWPGQLLAHFEAREDMLRAYRQHEEKLMDDSAWGPVYVPMALRPPNPLAQEKQRFLSVLRAEYSDKLAPRGFHCTRLTDDEVERIRKEGMTPSSVPMLQDRIRALEKTGLITAQVACRLIQRNSAADLNRVGRIWFVFTKALLRQETGMDSLFRYWGGEALYGQHDRDPEIGPMLASIGIARIIEATVLLSDMGPTAFPDTQMVQQFLMASGVPAGDRDYSGRTRAPVSTYHIRRIISREDEAFESLTGCAGWEPPL